MKGRRNVNAGDDLRDWIEAHDRGDGGVPFSAYYPESAAGSLRPYIGQGALVGRNVRWVGPTERMFLVDARYVYPIDGNIFDAQKLAAVARVVPEGVTFRTAYGQFGVVDRTVIAESIQYGHVQEWGQPYSTGDEELDRYLEDPDEAIYERDDVEPGERGYKTAKKRFEKELRAAERGGDGDFGEVTVQIRDGNHRVFGSIAGGEPMVWVLMMENQWQDLRGDPGSSPRFHSRALQKALGIPRRRRGRATREPVVARSFGAEDLWVHPHPLKRNARTRHQRAVRRVAIELKTPSPRSLHAAAPLMAALVTSSAPIFVPVPDSRGRTKANAKLAEAITRWAGGFVADGLVRRASVPSSRRRRRRGGVGLLPEQHGIVWRGPKIDVTRIYLVDNVIVTGGTLEASRRALGGGTGLAWARHL